MSKTVHTLNPIFDKNSRVLILGTMPSPKSREYGFYYMHPQNRFWRVMGILFDESIPESAEEKTQWLKKHNIALWDVLHSCDIKNAADSTIKNPVINDLGLIFTTSDIKRVFATGKKAAELYNKYCPYAEKYPITTLPSTSPANCAYSLDRLIDEYSKIKNTLYL